MNDANVDMLIGAGIMLAGMVYGWAVSHFNHRPYILDNRKDGQ